LTTFLAWLGADSRGPTSLYFASDSRISWEKDKHYWDTARKLFAPKSTAEIFGFTGYALLPQVVLTRVCDFIDRGFRNLAETDPVELYAAWLKEIVEGEARSHPAKYLVKDFSIFYALRIGKGMPGRSQFHLFHLHWSTRRQELSLLEIPSVSSVLQIHGTGTESLETWTTSWKLSDQGDTSRTFFSAFCDSLLGGKDEFSGGEPQFVGLYRNGNAQVFGVVSANGPSIEGCLVPNIAGHAKIEWRDQLFQRVNHRGELLRKAQRHARPANVRQP
jgi:hypothetical protein